MKKTLSQCENINREIKDLEERIEQIEEEGYKETKDSVRGSSSSFPYTSRSFTIEGIRENKKIDRYRAILEEKKDKLLDIKIEIEEELKKVDDSRIRQIIRFKYIDNKSWVQVGHKLRTTADGARMELKRFFKKF